MRSFWKGAITFGLVTIPIRLYVATESKDPKFRYLHVLDNAPVRYQKVCSACGKALEKEEIILGYEFQKDRFVPVPEEEIEGLRGDEDHAVEILAFVPGQSLDPLFFSKAYYIEPGEGGAKAYALLRSAMGESGRAAVAKVTLRTKPSFSLVRLHPSGALVMETLFDPDEVRDASGLSLPESAEVSQKELGLALTLVNALAGPFDPTGLADTYRASLKDLLEKKVATAAAQPDVQPEGKVIDLMAALEASIAQARKGEADVPADAGRGVAGAVR